jgi:hypothetical protein
MNSLSESDTKVQVYRTLYHMKRSFADIVAHCRALGNLRILSPKFTRLYQSYTQELQAEINWDVIEIMDGIESEDLFHFGKARTAREKELRDPDDVFIEAEERRQELVQQPRRKKRKTIQSRPITNKKADRR